MNRFSLVLVVAILAASAVSPAAADYIVNGDFETVADDGTFTGWTYGTYSGGSVTASTDSVIAGTCSAEIPKSTGSIGTVYIKQMFTESPADWVFSMDFSVLDSSTTQTMNIVLAYSSTGDTNSNHQINVAAAATGLLQAHQTGTGGGWKSIGTLTAELTEDTGEIGWDGETPVVNTLVIEGYFSDESPYYNVTLNDVTVENLTYNQNGAPVTGDSLARIQLQAYGAWLADNVSLVAAIPEPSSIILLGGGLLGLLAYAWRRRK